MQHRALEGNKKARLSGEKHPVWAVDVLPPSGMKNVILYIIFEF